jgi:hypothetical protein
MARTRQLETTRPQKGGLLRSWLALLFGIGPAGVTDEADNERSALQLEEATKVSTAAFEDHRALGDDSVVLPFPIYGEALLVRLADLLRRHVGNRTPVDNPFLFSLSRRPGSWLAIDHRSWVEFVASRAEFHFQVEVAPNTSITIRTIDFNALVEFVVQYVSAQLAKPPSSEVVP